MPRQEKGQGMVEYVLILLLIAMALIFAFSLIGDGIVNTLVSNIVSGI